MKYNIIFLDIDGVLNGYNKWNDLGWRLCCFLKIGLLKKWYRKITNVFGIHTRKVKRLAKIVHKTNAKVVLSTSWRNRLWYTPYENMYGDEKKFIDLCKKYKIEIIGITPRSKDGKRDGEIISWLSNNEDKVKKFIILDDERFDLECFVSSNLILTSDIKEGQMIMGFGYENTGLKRKHVREAIKKLTE